MSLFQGIKDNLSFQPNLHYGMVALGDSSHVNFCNGSKQFDALLQEQSTQRAGEVLLIDAGENPELETESDLWAEHWGMMLSRCVQRAVNAVLAMLGRVSPGKCQQELLHSADFYWRLPGVK